MSLIHQALKKVEAPRKHESGAGFAFKAGKAGLLRRYIIPAVFIISIIYASYLLLVPAAKEQPGAQTGIKNQTVAPQGAKQPEKDPHSKGIDEFRAGRYPAAEELFRKALPDSQAKEDVHNDLGLALMRLGRMAQAEDAFKKALEIRPEHPEALNNYACLLAESGKPKKALQLFERAVKAAPAYADARLNLAILLDRKGDLQGAISSYEEFMRLEPSSPDATQVRKRLMYLRSELIVKKAGGR